MARILYLDDEEPLVFMMGRMLKLLGHDPLTFTNPREAIAAFRGSPADFDLVLTDLSMPTMTGIEFATEILRVRRDASVAVLTGHATPRDVEEAKAAGALDVITKPGTLEQLERILTELLARVPPK